MKRIVLLSFCIAALTACKTDFDPNASGQDITVVFGLLDQNDTTHYIRISRAFVGEQDALIMAQDPAYSSYGDVLDVRVEEYIDGVSMREFYCERIIIYDKEDGVFYSSEQELYRFEGILHVKGLYRLVIENKETGKVVTAETGLISDFSVEKPFYNPANPQIGLVNNNWVYTSSEAKWRSAKNGRLYEPVFRFHYKEVDTAVDPTDTLYKHVDWKLGSQKAFSLNGGEVLTSSYNAESFYRLLEASISVDINKYRKHGLMDFMISVGGDDLSTYIDLNKPSNTIIQERPAYTNVSNGIGIFSCRFTKKNSFKLSAYSVDKLLNGEYTDMLGFQ